MRPSHLLGLLVLTGSLLATAMPAQQPATTKEFELLLHAVSEGDLELVRYFLARDIGDLNRTGRRGWSPLMIAADEDETRIARALIAAGADVNFHNKAGWSALTKAAEEGAYATAEVLLEHGAETTPSPGNVRSSPVAAAAKEGHLDIVHLLLSSGASIAHEAGREHPLHLAAAEGHLEVVHELLARGTPIDLTDDTGFTALGFAAAEGHTHVLSHLLKVGAAVDGAVGSTNCTPMSLAAGESQPEIIRLLAKAGARMETKCDFQEFDFLGSNDQDYSEIAQFTGATPLMVALSERNLASVRTLLQFGADVNTTTHKRAYRVDSETSHHLLVHMNDRERSEKLRLLYDEPGWTPLMEAVSSGQPALVKILLAAGADTMASTKNGLTARQLAQNLQLPDILHLLP